MAKDETREADPLDEQSCLVVAALADGERVDPAALKVALDDPGVRNYLVDLIALRQTVATAGDLPPARGRERGRLYSSIGWLSAAAAIVVSLTAGYLAGQRTVQTAPAPSVETVVDFSGSASAPKPTRVVSLRPGVNWIERVEGQ
jgi:hypothetical protein